MNNKTTHWRLETDADGVAWLALDKAGASSNSLSRDVMEELDAMLTELMQKRPKGNDRHFGEARLHRRRRHQGIRRHPHARPRTS